jgi:hypothetical protein
MDPASVTRALDRIEAKGCCARALHHRPARGATGADRTGTRRATQVPEVLCEVLNGHLARLQRCGMPLMLSMLQRMLVNGDALREAAAPAAPGRPRHPRQHAAVPTACGREATPES